MDGCGGGRPCSGMAALTGNLISADGSYTVDTVPGHSYTVMVGGTFGGATVNFSVWNEMGVTIVIPTYGSTTSAAVFMFTAPGTKLVIDVSGSTSPSIKLSVNHIPV